MCFNVTVFEQTAQLLNVLSIKLSMPCTSFFPKSIIPIFAACNPAGKKHISAQTWNGFAFDETLYRGQLMKASDACISTAQLALGHSILVYLILFPPPSSAITWYFNIKWHKSWWKITLWNVIKIDFMTSWLSFVQEKSGAYSFPWIEWSLVILHAHGTSN